MATVVSLTGAPVEAHDGNVVSAEVVEKLEELLADAKRGDIRAIGVAIVRPGYNTSTMYAVDPAEPCSHELMAAISYLQHRYAAHKVESAEPADTSA